MESEECVINIISEHFIEAANSTSINAPYGESEWSLSGLTPAPSTTVKASRVKEAIFAVEGKLTFTKEWESRATPGKKTGVLAIIEGTRFWVREDAINEDRNLVDPAVSLLERVIWKHALTSIDSQASEQIGWDHIWPNDGRH